MTLHSPYYLCIIYWIRVSICPAFRSEASNCYTGRIKTLYFFNCHPAPESKGKISTPLDSEPPSSLTPSDQNADHRVETDSPKYLEQSCSNVSAMKVDLEPKPANRKIFKQLQDTNAIQFIPPGGTFRSITLSMTCNLDCTFTMIHIMQKLNPSSQVLSTTTTT